MLGERFVRPDVVQLLRDLGRAAAECEEARNDRRFVVLEVDVEGRGGPLGSPERCRPGPTSPCIPPAHQTPCAALRHRTDRRRLRGEGSPAACSASRPSSAAVRSSAAQEVFPRAWVRWPSQSPDRLGSGLGIHQRLCQPLGGLRPLRPAGQRDRSHPATRRSPRGCRPVPGPRSPSPEAAAGLVAVEGQEDLGYALLGQRSRSGARPETRSQEQREPRDRRGRQQKERGAGGSPRRVRRPPLRIRGPTGPAGPLIHQGTSGLPAGCFVTPD